MPRTVEERTAQERALLERVWQILREAGHTLWEEDEDAARAGAGDVSEAEPGVAAGETEIGGAGAEVVGAEAEGDGAETEAGEAAAEVGGAEAETGEAGAEISGSGAEISGPGAEGLVPETQDVPPDAEGAAEIAGGPAARDDAAPAGGPVARDDAAPAGSPAARDDAAPADGDDAPETLEELIDELQPYDIAYVLQELDRSEQLELLALTPPRLAAAALEHLDFELQYRLLDHVGEEYARPILAEMPLHHLVMLVNAVHPLRAEVLLRMVPDEAKPHIAQMQTLPDNAAGRLISVRHFEAREGWTARQVIAHFRKVGENVDVTNYVYVVDNIGRLVGVASFRDVLLSPDDTLLSDIMYTKVVAVEAEAPREEAARLLSQYDFVALPVVDAAGRLLGVISADDILDVLEEEATEDIHFMGGSTPFEESYLDTTVGTLFRSRITWLLVLFLAQSVTSTIIRNYEDVLQQVIALSFFIPLLIGTGGNSGSQAATVITRAVALGEITMKDFVTVVWRELRVSLLLGLVMAAVVFLRATVMGEAWIIGLTVGVTSCLVVIVGATAGATLPLIGKRLGLDPAVFSAPLITT
ncbi:MAG: magnesium transporter, partial [Limnochordales bacterium]